MLDLFALPWSWIWLSDVFRRERCPSRRPAQVEIFLFMLSDIKETQTLGDAGMNARLFVIFKGVNSRKGCSQVSAASQQPTGARGLLPPCR